MYILSAQRISGKKDFKLHFLSQILLNNLENLSCILDKLLNIIKIIEISATFTKQYNSF